MTSPAQFYERAVQFHRTGNLREAELLYRQILATDPQHADALHLLGVIAHQVGRNDLAVEYMQQALRLQPDFPDAYNNLGNALLALGKPAEAQAHFQQALRLMPGLAAAYMNLGNALYDQGKLDDAVANYQEALRLKPDLANAYSNLGNVLKNQGRLDEALAAYRNALALAPARADFHSNLVYALSFHPQYDAAAVLQECRRWNQRHAEPLAKFIQPHANDRTVGRRLRVGYVSPDFRNHPVASFTIPLLSHHDHGEFEIFCYAGAVRPDALTERHRGYADVWRDTVGLSDESLAEQVRRDRIDILVDLTMHMANSRLLVFARKPAPVQVAWLAYAGTTGLSAMDYRLTDPHLDPPEQDDAVYTEKSIRLPETFWCYDPLSDQPVHGLPALQAGHITFACLNNYAKVTPDVLTVWARVLHAVPHSRLILLTPQGRSRDQALALFQQEGITPARLEFVQIQPRPEYFKQYNQIDVCLDPWPYNGGTTSLDALWMGVPIITRVGKTVVGRAGWSLLSNLGLQELAARTPEEYVTIAARLSGDLSRLTHLRATLRARLQASPLMDAGRFARHIEHAYQQMWHSREKVDSQSPGK